MLKDLYLVIKNKIVSIPLILILFFNFLGLAFSFYKTFFWYDIFLHFFGGAWVALLVIYWPKFKGQFYTLSQKIIFTMIVVMIIGFAWEIMEIFADGILDLKFYADSGVARELRAGYTKDTLLDLMMDFIGGVSIGYLFMKRKYT
ncbi:MAG: hypothetical protein A3H51_02920 [Candidatus Spechtbacteria bacterium RIFCSPLOWO2_02_FULL_38_8]|uniref:VanZ-like domain-containing protein n=1 Tax=Candidatus Spechtbacteria bacterium RIFCSPLOWO2_02_FULL_38_8 TaxID=1802164 RepID=A0A1G2HHE9_9BACT|nr:MAG: hypothetical protein A3H51_02920 [Candidatus Spechtbacteria bacterium RIFCSPLOWO2_02_FULL_38_8]